MGLLIPETAGIRGNLVSQDDLALVAAELDLKVHQVDAQAVKIFLHHFVYLEGVFCDGYEQLDHVILAGGFGSYLKKESAAAIGLIPKELLPITESVGNAAGEGAVSAAISKKAREQLSIIQKSMHYIELSTHPDFSQEYMNQMDFDGSER